MSRDLVQAAAEAWQLLSRAHEADEPDVAGSGGSATPAGASRPRDRAPEHARVTGYLGMALAHGTRTTEAHGTPEADSARQCVCCGKAGRGWSATGSSRHGQPGMLVDRFSGTRESLTSQKQSKAAGGCRDRPGSSPLNTTVIFNLAIAQVTCWGGPRRRCARRSRRVATVAGGRTPAALVNRARISAELAELWNCSTPEVASRRAEQGGCLAPPGVASARAGRHASPRTACRPGCSADPRSRRHRRGRVIRRRHGCAA